MTLVLSRIGRVVPLLTGVTILLVGAAGAASAHPLSTSAVRLDVGATQVTATIDLPLDQLSVARGRRLTATNVVATPTLKDLRAYVQSHLSASDAASRTWTTRVAGGRVTAIDGVDNRRPAAAGRPRGR